MKKMTKANYRGFVWLSLEELADWIAEFNADGERDGTAWDFWRWLDKHAKPK
jgi:hypothetical protein